MSTVRITLIGLTTLGALAAAPPVTGVAFAPAHDIAAGSVSGVSSMDAGRIDGDALPDVVAVEGGMHAGGRRTLAWFRAPDVAGGAWTRHEINPSAPLRRFLGAAKLADVSGDGHLDLVISSDNHSGSTRQADLYVFINPGPAAVTGPWSYQRVTPATLPLHHINDMEVADLDLDGKPDIVIRSLDPGQIHLFFQNSMTSWSRTVIETGITAASEGLAVGRIDADARPDLTYTGFLLLAPSNPRTGAYVRHPIDSAYHSVNQNTKEALGDVDGDGRLDLVIAPAESFRNGANHVLAWYRNPGSYGANWPRTVIRSGTNNHHTVKFADMDGDGHLDVVTGKPWSAAGIPKETLIFFGDGSGGFARTQTVVSGRGLYSGVVVDIGDDGDLDIVGQDSYASTSRPWLYESRESDVPVSDTQAPSVPGNLRVTAAGTSSIAIAWNPGSDDTGVTGYELRRDGARLASVATTSYMDAGLSAATTYTYAVRARDAAGNWSAWSTSVVAVTLGATAAHDAFGRIEAESYDDQFGLGIFGSGSQQWIGSIHDGEWARYDAVDFGAGATFARLRASSRTRGGTVELRIGSVDGPVLGGCVVPGTGSWSAYIDVSCSVSGATGVHALYLVFRGGTGFLVDIDYFTFLGGSGGR